VFEETYWFMVQSVAVQLVSEPEASFPAAFVVPAAQLAHVFEETYWFMVQSVAVQLVSEPEASFPAAFVVPAAQLVHVFEETYWFVVHVIAVQLVSAPVGSSPDERVVPAAQLVHTFEETYWPVEQNLTHLNAYCMSVPEQAVNVFSQSTIRHALFVVDAEVASKLLPESGLVFTLLWRKAR
jgi:hypothetical protein